MSFNTRAITRRIANQQQSQLIRTAAGTLATSAIVALPRYIRNAKQAISYVYNLIRNGRIASDRATQMINEVRELANEGGAITDQIRSQINDAWEAIIGPRDGEIQHIEGHMRGAPRPRTENNIENNPPSKFIL